MAEKRGSFFNRLIPRFIRTPLYNYLDKITVLRYYSDLAEELVNPEEKTALDYLKNNKLGVFPYPFQKKYNKNKIIVFKDELLKLKYVVHDGKRLYFRRKSSTRGIKRNYNALLMEQDINSPHRYLTSDYRVNTNDILVDIGAAEGILALSVIDIVKKVYLFETDQNWIEALEATFSPWIDKVEIINKFVSDRNDENHVSLDEYFNGNLKIDFLKVDVEGAEEKVLQGAAKILSENESLKVALCTYHKPDDAVFFEKYFKDRNFKTSFSNGYMIFNEPKAFYPPYLRKGVLRAEKIFD